MRQKMNESFVFYGTNLDMVDKLKEVNPELANELLYSIVEYGIYGEYETDNPIVEAMMAPVVNGIDKAKGRYALKKESAAKKQHYQEIAKLHLEGKTQTEIAKILSNKFGEKISQQTVSYRLGVIHKDFPDLLVPKEEEIQEIQDLQKPDFGIY